MPNINDSTIKHYLEMEVKKLESDRQITAQDRIIVNSIITIKRLIEELEKIEKLLINSTQARSQNAVLITSAYLEIMINELKKIKQEYLEK